MTKDASVKVQLAIGSVSSIPVLRVHSPLSSVGG
jgi:hypothetical protein